MPQPEQFETLVLGSGKAASYWPGTWRVRAAHRRRRAPLDWRLLPQHQLPSQQERDLEREGRRFGASRRELRRR